jgi:hypothetical protein
MGGGLLLLEDDEELLLEELELLDDDGLLLLGGGAPNGESLSIAAVFSALPDDDDELLLEELLLLEGELGSDSFEMNSSRRCNAILSTSKYNASSGFACCVSASMLLGNAKGLGTPVLEDESDSDDDVSFLAHAAANFLTSFGLRPSMYL